MRPNTRLTVRLGPWLAARARRSVTTTSSAASNRDSQTFRLPDGRLLGFAEYGCPDGKPLLYFHGYPSSRFEAKPVDDLARKMGVRFISLERPGFGLSSPQPHRRLLDWPVDVERFAKDKGLDRFAVMGLSGGGPYALACAYALPRGMLTAVGLFASGPQWKAGAHRMTLTRRLTKHMANSWPATLRVTVDAMIRTMRWIAARDVARRRLDRWFARLLAKGQEKPGTDEAKAKLLRSAREERERMVKIVLEEPFAQGADAAVEEARLLSDLDWGFALEDVDFDPIRIWHGSVDVNAPIEMMRWMQRKLPHGILTEFDGDSHYAMGKHIERALTELMEDDARSGRSDATDLDPRADQAHGRRQNGA
ncbi:hypothetical protein DCS_04212 [Drechmeria coniospora]|uniref:AB hydrolase-1 domain-containing protein n=1 Tax=Drechmeria coniospora TaxID=98403 RepID=A0A151GJB3_DRECN|nr:hypothetical protein DCS_04212 [Drechmeria coniospora]KYK57205.1 hypothetical protein DCS_04212 [Drechmeria coniospora]ODA79111.1 hypothetical protein RJ55_04702 [Drechmeria coniospora]